jgi:poly(glycerol-phosphate) alpha-glucosyltransferase
MWQYPSYAALKSSIPYITTVHGMLDSWAIKNSAFKKKIARLLFENQALNSASCLQAFTIQEYNDIREYGLRNPVCIIPNGVDVPDHLEELRMNVAPWGGKIEPGKKVLLYLGRIHPKKGLVNLIKAWKDVTSQGFSLEEWSLVIAGWNQGDHEQQLKELTKEAKLERDIHFIGPQFGLQKEITLAHADAFILPSFSEGLPMAVLEAWAFGLPVIMTPQCNLPEGFEAGAAVCIQPSVMGVAEGLKSTLRLSPEELNSMGAAGRLLVKQKFSWKEVAKKMNVIYEWILSKKETPSYLIEN